MLRGRARKRTLRLVRNLRLSRPSPKRGRVLIAWRRHEFSARDRWSISVAKYLLDSVMPVAFLAGRPPLCGQHGCGKRVIAESWMCLNQLFSRQAIAKTPDHAEIAKQDVQVSCEIIPPLLAPSASRHLAPVEQSPSMGGSARNPAPSTSAFGLESALRCAKIKTYATAARGCNIRSLSIAEVRCEAGGEWLLLDAICIEAAIPLSASTCHRRNVGVSCRQPGSRPTAFHPNQ